MTVLRVLRRKIRSAGIRWQAHRRHLAERRIEKVRAAAARQWLRDFSQTSAEVLIGANFVDMGGCRQHMHSLAKFSSLKTLLVPDTQTIEKCGASLFSGIAPDFLNTAPAPAVRAVHSHVFPWMIDWCLQQRNRIPVWVHTHHLWYYEQHSSGQPVEWHREFNNSFCKALKNCDVPLCVSRWQQHFLLQEHGIRTEYLPNGVDLSLCLAGVGQAFHDAFDIPAGFILWVGRNDPVKNPADFLTLATLMPHLTFCMVGPGLSAQSLLADYAVEVPSNVRFTGRLSQAQVQHAVAACRVLVVTSLREGLPTLVLEGLAQQKPMVVPAEAGCMEALGGPEFGDIYELNSPVSLVNALKACLDRPQQNPQALERVRDEFDWPVIMRKLDLIYRGGV